MNSNELQMFYNQLEKLVTYNNEDITDEDFYKDLNLLKKIYKNLDKKMPNEIQLSKTKLDFRSEFQKLGGYKERRERLKEIIYPIIDIIEEQEIQRISKDNKTITQSQINDYLKNNNFEIKTKMGIIKDISLDSKSGGNGVVYFGNMNKHDVAIKVLINMNNNKKERFLYEFINVIMEIDNYDGIVKQYFYDEININNTIIPIIVMKKYNNHLIYKEKMSDDELVSIFTQIIKAVKKLHSRGIIHRDLKPQNILIDENNRLNIADFGIAYYDSELYEFKVKTEKGDRLANFDFSAPEQKDCKCNPTFATDIYSIGQIMQWLVYDMPHKGTHRKSITEKYNGSRMELLDKIIDKCLSNMPNDRYQSIEEIELDIENNKETIKSENNETNKETSINPISKNEVKEQLKDIMDNIVFSESLDKYGNIESYVNFKIFDELTDMDVTQFLINIPNNLKKLLFNDQVKISDFLNTKTVFSESFINKDYFEKLYNLYNNIKENEELILPFITYIRNRVNDNCFEITF